jgi:hypothetical protein
MKGANIMKQWNSPEMKELNVSNTEKWADEGNNVDAWLWDDENKEVLKYYYSGPGDGPGGPQ